jgi:hypothetical protein
MDYHDGENTRGSRPGGQVVWNRAIESDEIALTEFLFPLRSDPNSC